MSGIASSTKGMIFLQTEHPVILETLREKLAPDAKQEPVDIAVADFDDVTYRMVVEGTSKNVIKFKLGMPYLKELRSMGASGVLSSDYGEWQSSGSDREYDQEFSIDVTKVRDAEKVARLFAEIKRNMMAAPFRSCFEALAAGKSSSVKPMVIPFRPTERIVLNPGSDRVQVYFTINFQDETDRAIARVFLQEFSESQRKVPQAPNVTFTTDCPADLAKVREFKPSKDIVGYLMFQVFKSHVEGKEKMEKVITLFQGFRAYLHYHIKASKAHLHTRMRNRVDLLLKVLKRADPRMEGDAGGSKKAYRTFNN